jgi:hypothetical protein
VIHYHGTPITPQSVMGELTGRCFCVSYATYRQGKDTVEQAHQIGQSVMLDNGAFSFWRVGRATDWTGFYDWAEPWLDHQTTWAVIPDVIDGSAEDNDRLLGKWFQRRLPRGAPVWHMHEPIDRLKRLCHGYPRVCIGSSAQYATVGTDAWHRRMVQAMNELVGTGAVPTWLHMLRGMALAGSEYPFSSVDSTDIARNHNRPRNSARGMADYWDSRQNPARWVHHEQLELVA